VKARARRSVLALLAAALAGSGPLAAAPRAARADGVVVVRAGTVVLVDEGRTQTDGYVVIRDGVIERVGGGEVATPVGGRLVDYGPDAVVVPGLVSAESGYGVGAASSRTVAPDVAAIDGYDPYGRFAPALAGGVTTAYLPPANGRLIAGQGAVVKLAGEDLEGRVLRARASIHGAVHAGVRSVPGYWEIPVPATVDVGIGWAVPQLPDTTMGALYALSSLVDAARDGRELPEFGPHAASELRALMDAGLVWRLGARTAPEIRALLRFAAEKELPLVLSEARDAAAVADEIAAAGVPVVYELPYTPNRAGLDRGTDPDDVWPSFDVPAALVRAGVEVAIARGGASTRDLAAAAQLASRGGLTRRDALRAITEWPAKILGVADRVGTLAPGKDGDLAVFNGHPLDAGSSVLATWVGGELAWSSEADRGVVIAVDALHVGDGEVLRPGEVLIRDGVIRDVGTHVARPPGATVVRGAAAMPGAIDGLGYLGLEGSRSNPGTDYPLRRIVGPGDDADRRVARAGVTTVLLTSRGTSGSGTPVMAYKPAAADGERQVVADPVTLRLEWTHRNRLKSGEEVRELLAKAVEYRAKWQEYEQELAEWVPDPPEPEEEDGEDEDDEEDEDEDDEDDDDEKKRKKDDDDEEESGDRVTGVWEGTLADADATSPVRLQLRLRGTDVDGSVRSTALSAELIEVTGTWSDGELALTGLGTRGWVELAGTPEKGELEGTAGVGGASLELAAKRTSEVYPVAGRRERTEEAPDEEDDRGRPREPKLDEKLEPLRRALEGEGTLIVSVDRDDEILDCVAAFEAHGIRPVLYGARDVHHVIDAVAGRVAAILPSHTVLEPADDFGTDYRNNYAALQGAGIPVLFHSRAEEGAADLLTMAAYAVSRGMGADGALRALTADAADAFGIGDRVGRLARGLDGDLLLLDGPPLHPSTSVLRAWVAGREVTR